MSHPCCYWMTGYSGAGKTTLARAMQAHWNADGTVRLVVLDGDVVRKGLCSDLGFSLNDRFENSRRLASMARLLLDEGLSVVVSAISPYSAARAAARAQFARGTFVEVHVATPLSACMARDAKGLYQQAKNGKLPRLTGIGSTYEEPFNPEVRVNGEGDLMEQVEQIAKASGFVIAMQDSHVTLSAHRGLT